MAKPLNPPQPAHPEDVELYDDEYVSIRDRDTRLNGRRHPDTAPEIMASRRREHVEPIAATPMAVADTVTAMVDTEDRATSANVFVLNKVLHALSPALST